MLFTGYHKNTAYTPLVRWCTDTPHTMYDIHIHAHLPTTYAGTAPNSRVSTTNSTRSRLLEITKGSYDAEVDGAKTNKSLFRVARSQTLLKDPKKNSFVLGYWQDDHEG